MDFLAVDWLWALLFVPAVAALSVFASRRRVKVLTRLLGPRADDPDYVNVSKPRRTLRSWIFATATCLLVVAVARPYWGNRLLPFTGKGRDVLLVLDVSKSMMSTDMAGGGGKGSPTRLKHAKWLLRELIAATPGDRYGIIVFAGKAFLECPLTGDRTSLYNILNDISTDSVPVGGTNIEEALTVALRAFQAAAGGYKAVVLLSDGDEVYGQGEKAMAEVKRLKIPLLVVGVGDPERGIIRVPDEKGNLRTVLDAQGNPVNSKLNEALLRKMAVETDGVYVRSTSAEPGLAPLEKRIEQLVPEKYSEGKMTRPLERFHLPLLAAILLYLLWLGVGETTCPPRNGAKAAGLAVAFLGLLAAGGAQAQDSPRDDRPALAAKATPQDKADAIASFNAGVDAQQLNDSDKAEKCYTDAINLAAAKPDVRASAYQNLGVMRHQSARLALAQEPEKSLKDLDQAEELYRESMRSSPGRRQVAVNQQLLLSDRKAAQEIIKRRQEMEKKQKEAQEKTQQALDQQRQANQSKDKQQQKQQQQQADQKTHDAKQAAQDLEQAAQKADKPQEAQKAQQAAKDLDNARQEQKQGDGKAAEKDLEKAMQKLGGEQNQRQREENKRQDAEDKTQQAMQKQQEANQSQDKQEQEAKQQEAKDKTDEAKKATDDYQKSNPDPKRKEKGEEAKEALEKAQEQQKQRQGEKAEDSLKKALEKLRANKAEDKKDQEKKDGEAQQDKPQQDKPEQQKQPQQAQEGKPEGQRKYDDKEIDPQQAARLLDLMAKEEKSLREELKQRAKENSGVAPVEKDW